MNLLQLINGNKTYAVVLAALAYVIWAKITGHPIDSEILYLFGFSSVGTLRHSIQKLAGVTEDEAPSAPNQKPEPNNGTITPSSGFLRFPLLLTIMVMALATILIIVMSGCAGSAERRAHTSVSIGLDAISAGRDAYTRNLAAREKAAVVKAQAEADPTKTDAVAAAVAKDAALATFAGERQKYIDTVKQYVAATDAAIITWATIHNATQGNPTAAQLAEISDDFALARQALLAIIGEFIPAK
jgi:hypothetical protein